MKRISNLDVKIDRFLKVKKRTLAITNCDARSNSKDKIKGDGQASFHPVTIREVDNLEDETESAKAT